MEARPLSVSVPDGASISAALICHACQRLFQGRICSRPPSSPCSSRSRAVLWGDSRPGEFWAVCERCFLLDVIASLARQLGEEHPRSEWIDQQLWAAFLPLGESPPADPVPSRVSLSAVHLCEACQRQVRRPLYSHRASETLWRICERCFLFVKIPSLVRQLGEAHPQCAWIDDQLSLIYSELRESCHIGLLGQFYDRFNQLQSDIARAEDVKRKRVDFAAGPEELEAAAQRGLFLDSKVGWPGLWPFFLAVRLLHLVRFLLEVVGPDSDCPLL